MPTKERLDPEHTVTVIAAENETEDRKILARHLTFPKAIRAKCLDCSGNSPSQVRTCLCPECPLYPFRFGCRPKFKGDTGTPQRRATFQARDRREGVKVPASPAASPNRVGKRVHGTRIGRPR